MQLSSQLQFYAGYAINQALFATFTLDCLIRKQRE